MIVNGYCDEKFASVREEFERNFEQRGDIGASFAATIEGEFVIDIWGGHRNAAKSIAWEEDTIVNVFSSTKPFYFLAALMLADRGQLVFEDKVTKYWPEYGQKGKEATEIRHLMSHSAGLPGFGVQLSLEQICDWEFVIGVLERQEPWWEPG
ncbi:MAG: beta-lactamase family protein, partial [Woeseiaceae bacterium]|nr:beta-lactamase family protein [Woeseiaceae bacterium]